MAEEAVERSMESESVVVESDANKGGQRGRPSNLLAGLQQALRGAEKVDASRKRLQVKNRQLKAQLASKTSELRQLQIQFESQLEERLRAARESDEAAWEEEKRLLEDELATAEQEMQMAQHETGQLRVQVSHMTTDVELLGRLRGQNLDGLSLGELVLLQVQAHRGLAGIQVAVTEAVDRLGEQGVQVPCCFLCRGDAAVPNHMFTCGHAMCGACIQRVPECPFCHTRSDVLQIRFDP